MKITLLGTGSPIPDPLRAGPCTLVQAGDRNILVDCGRGALMRSMAAGVLPAMIDTLLITHLHSDHITDVNDLVTTRWVMQPVHVPLKVYGPAGTRAMIDALMRMLELDQQYRHDHHDDLRANGPLTVDVTEVGPNETFAIGAVKVTTHATDHRPVKPTVGFRLEHDGRVAALAGDTVPCAGVDAMCAGADAYVQTVIRADLVNMVANMVPTGGRFKDILDYHSTVEQAAQTATRNGVKNLMLTHYVPPLQAAQEDEWRALAAQHFDGNIVLGPDLTSLDI
ncbi:MAG: MBL fold metallo-hydrolase [Actinomycetota bacterium]